jgi:16S rRNA processing protein RimM
LESLAAEHRDQFLAIARIVKPQGRKGEVAAEILTDFPGRFQGLQRAYLERPGTSPEPVVVENAWPHKHRIILRFSGVDSIEEADRLRGLYVLIPSQERTRLGARQFYVSDLKGCRVLREHQGALTEVGTVTDVEPTGGVDLLRVALVDGQGGEVEGGGKLRETLIPLAEAICTRFDLEAKIIVINPPEDLLDLNE